MSCRQITFCNGYEAGETRLRRQKIVTAFIQDRVIDRIANGEQFTFFIDEKAELRRVRYILCCVSNRRQTTIENLNFLGQKCCLLAVQLHHPLKCVYILRQQWIAGIILKSLAHCVYNSLNRAPFEFGSSLSR